MSAAPWLPSLGACAWWTARFAVAIAAVTLGAWLLLVHTGRKWNR